MKACRPLQDWRVCARTGCTHTPAISHTGPQISFRAAARQERNLGTSGEEASRDKHLIQAHNLSVEWRDGMVGGHSLEFEDGGVGPHRHYTFYVWRALRGGSATARRALLPGYLAALALLGAAAAEAQPPLWVAGWAACTAAVLAPAALLEFRCAPPPPPPPRTQPLPPQLRVGVDPPTPAPGHLPGCAVRVWRALCMTAPPQAAHRVQQAAHRLQLTNSAACRMQHIADVTRSLVEQSMLQLMGTCPSAQLVAVFGLMPLLLYEDGELSKPPWREVGRSSTPR